MHLDPSRCKLESPYSCPLTILISHSSSTCLLAEDKITPNAPTAAARIDDYKAKLDKSNVSPSPAERNDLLGAPHTFHLLDMPAAYAVRDDARNKKQSMADLKLRRLNELNLRLKEDLDRPRVKVAEASIS